MSFAILRATLLVATAALSFNTTAAQRTFVSTSGSDANTASNCSNTLPCRGFTAALTVTDSGGEIIVLSSGGYGPVTIDKSVSIIAPDGVYAGISVFSGNGITIATAGVNVVLRGLSVNRLGGTGNGVHMTDGASLAVRDCTLTNFSGASGSTGLLVSGSVQVRLIDSLLQGNAYGATLINGPTVLVSGSRFLAGANGLYANSGRVHVSRSEVSGNTSRGFYVTVGTATQAEVNIKDSVASGNDRGVLVTSNDGTGTALVTVSNSLISGNITAGLQVSSIGAKLVASGNKVSHNGTGLSQGSSGVLQSTGDNTVTDNTTNASGTITPLTNM
ncbi:MAG: hypothetical protein HYZ17_17980 [Betaproteobacteria bacterium]|nr:hypothetical protein [Betaproteobacteria bacterium]